VTVCFVEARVRGSIDSSQEGSEVTESNKLEVEINGERSRSNHPD